MHPKQHLIPLDHIEEIKTLSGWLENLPRGLPQGDDRTRYLFEIYNTYLSTGNREELESCASCRGKVEWNIKLLLDE